MSASLMWRPRHTGKSLPDALRFALQKEYGLDGSATTITFADAPFLRGLIAGMVDGAQELLDAVEKFDSIEVWLEY